MDRGAMSQLSQFWNVIRNVAKGRLESATAIVSVAAKSTNALDLQRKIQLPFVLEPRTLAFGEDAKNHIPADIQSHGRSVQRREVSVEADKGRGICRQVQVRSPLVDDAGQQLNKINLNHFLLDYRRVACEDELIPRRARTSS